MCQSVGCHGTLMHTIHHSLTLSERRWMNICHYCQETGRNTCVEGGKLIKRPEKWYYSPDREICQSSLAWGELPWTCPCSSGCILSETKLKDNLAWNLCLLIVWNVSFFSLCFWKATVNKFDFTLASSLEWSATQCVPLSLHLHVLLQADFWGLCQRKSIVFEMLASRQHRPTSCIREEEKRARLLNQNSSSSFGHGRGRPFVYIITAVDLIN